MQSTKSYKSPSSGGDGGDEEERKLLKGWKPINCLDVMGVIKMGILQIVNLTPITTYNQRVWSVE